MTVARDSTSYPTLAVIQEFAVTDADRRAIWGLSGAMAAWLWSGAPESDLTHAEHPVNAAWAIVQSLLGRDTAVAIEDRLEENLKRAIRWCQDNRA